MSDTPVETPAAAKPVDAPEAVPEAVPEAAPEATPKPAEAVPKPAEAAPEAAKPAETAETAPEAAPETAEAETPKAATPLETLYAAFREQTHPEIWGVTLADPATDVPSQIVFQKYLNANDGDVAKAREQMLATLQWRAQMQPLALMARCHNRDKFAGLGYVTAYTAGTGAYDPAAPETKEVFTWNVYGSTKSIDTTFGNLDEFIHWRVALMELALQELSLATATKPITADEDPYKIVQVHDYKSISFLRQSSHVKAASQETIKVFAQNYPELLKEKFFVNVPAIMGFVYAFMKLFVAAKTIKKFHPMSNGTALHNEFAGSAITDLGQRLPKEYGGASAELRTVGKEPLLEAVTEAAAPAAAAKEEAKEEAKEVKPEETKLAAAESAAEAKATTA